MNAFRRGIQSLQALNDPRLSQAYEAYVQRVEGRLSEEEMELYRSYLQRGQSTSAARPEELAVAEKVDADPEINKLYLEYLGLLGGHQVQGQTAPREQLMSREVGR